MGSLTDQVGARTALVTGASGFTGRHLSDRLIAGGYSVVGWSGKGRDGVHGVGAVDLVDRQAVIAAIDAIRPEVVVHLAAITHVMHADVGEIYQTNVMGTRNLLEALSAHEAKQPKVIVASSANVYGNAGGRLSEADRPNPSNDYAISKAAMEMVAATWRDRLDITVVRPFNYTGVGQSESFLIPKIVGHFRRREPFIELGNLDVARDFSDVRDVVAAYETLLHCDGAEGTFNVCSGVSIALRSVIESLEEISGHRIEVRTNASLMRRNEVLELRGDNRRIRSVAGWTPRIPFSETLRWMYEAAAD